MPHLKDTDFDLYRFTKLALGLKTIRQFIIRRLNFDEQRRIVAYLDGLQAKVNALPAMRFSGRLQSASGEVLLPPFYCGDASQSALLPSILDNAFKGEL